jgi:hypothetical protein
MSFVLQYVSTIFDFKELQTSTDPEIIMEKIKDYILPILLITVLNLFMVTIIQHYIIFSPLDETNSIFVSVVQSLKYFIPYLIIMVLLAFAGSVIIALGVVVLIIGVFFSIIYLITLYMFILPVMMAEGTNIAHVITRTIKLAHRNFWRNLGWVAILLIILIVASVILSGVILIPFTGSFLRTIVETQDTESVSNLIQNPAFFALSSVANALIFPLMPIFACILYFNGRAREDSPVEAEVTSDDKVKVEDLYAKPIDEDDKTGKYE